MDALDKLDTCGAGDGGGSGEKFRQLIAAEIAKSAKVVKDGRVKVES
jgi:hypothetical protein